MLKKKNRLNRQLVAKAIKRGQVINYGNLRLFFLLNRLDYSRLAVVIPKKVCKKSTQRNLIKRRFRAAWEEIFNQIGFDFVLMVYKEQYRFPDCQQILQRLKLSFDNKQNSKIE
ncbi:MAG: ribonuclease P protein component [Candidatus Moranbacteria bacterium]|nr:ribonuclease P protein component [Candidatus Moranbacteria bacterium]